jgi:hypothetical protein
VLIGQAHHLKQFSKKAARYKFDLAAKLFGLIVWVVFMERDRVGRLHGTT